MKKFLVVLGALALGLSACGLANPLPQEEVGSGNTEIVVPGGFSSLQSALVALNTACGAGQPITWTYAPASAAGYVAARDGSVVGGKFIAPICGSPYLGQKVNVVGSCAKADNSQTFIATVVFSIQQEQLGGTTVAFAAVNDCGQATACSAANPLSISPSVCTATQTPFTVQLYTKLDFTCGPVYDPATPPTGLAACSTAISPGVNGPALCTSFTYSAWSTCSAGGTQTRTVLTSSPAGCIGGTPVLSQACTPPPNGAVLWTNNCQGCHGPIGGDQRGASANQIQQAINNNVGGMGRTTLRALTPAEVAAIAAANP
jgi:hypothetical protein